MINGLDLFSGIGGISLALSEWVRPIAYCEIDKYCQQVLQSRFADRTLFAAPIWDDVTTLHGSDLPDQPDIIYGGFPCQDISNAGTGKGLAGERSGLFFEIVRLCSEIRPTFVFLENVAAITIRGADRVGAELASLGYDCRWAIISANSVGAPHERKRWWLLAYSDAGRIMRHADQNGQMAKDARKKGIFAIQAGINSIMVPSQPSRMGMASSWWDPESPVARVADGIPDRLDRVRALGNSVVPQCACEAFMYLMGLENDHSK